MGSDLKEYLLILGIVFCLCYIFWPLPEIKEIKAPEISMEEEPVQAWSDTDDGGGIVKIKYKIDKKNVTIWITDANTGKLVHKQPFDMDPYPDDYNKPDRVHTYIWKLYETEWSDYIPSGIYEINVGAYRKSNNNYFLEITI